MKASCDMILLVQAELDGELDAAQAASIAAHRAHCPICADAHRRIAAVRGLMREKPSYYRAPAHLSRGLGARPAEKRRWREGVLGFGLGAALAASVAVAILAPAPAGDADQIAAAHIRALQPGHLLDVVSTDQHNVKPWFDGKLDFAPPVRTIPGFPLAGGRLDYLAGHPAAAVVYQRGRHLINLFAWPAAGAADTSPRLDQRKGYNILHWTGKGMSLWAVSDLNPAELEAFANNFRESE